MMGEKQAAQEGAQLRLQKRVRLARGVPRRMGRAGRGLARQRGPELVEIKEEEGAWSPGQLGGIAHCSGIPGRGGTKKLSLEGDRVEGRDAQEQDARVRWVRGLHHWALRRHLSGK